MRLRLPATALALTLGLAVVPHAAPAASADPVPRPDHQAAKAVAALDRVRDVLAGSGHGRSATIAMRNLWMRMDSLSSADRAEARALLARPNMPTKVCQATICVHYATSGADAVDLTDADANGVPDYVDLTLATVLHIHDVYKDAGYREPLPDAGKNGSDALDVFLQDDGAKDLYGYCAPDQKTPRGVYTSWSYCSFDNDFRSGQFPTHTPEQNLEVTAAHEYFHATQFAYDAYEDSWLLEATATWAEDELYPDVNDNLQYLSDGPIGKPGKPLDYAKGCCHQYGTWIFFRYLTEQYPDLSGGLPVLVRDLWDRLDSNPGSPDDYSMQGVVHTLAARGVSLSQALAAFAIANRFPAAAYAEGSLYPTAPAGSVSISSPTANPSAFTRTLDHLSTATVRYVPTALTDPNQKLRLAFNLADKRYGSAAAITVVDQTGNVTWGTVTLNKSGNATVSVPFDSADVASVEVTLLNAGAAYRCWTGGAYSCNGTSKDDDLKQKVDPVAYVG